MGDGVADLKKHKDAAKAGVEIYLKIHKLIEDFGRGPPDALMLTALDTIRSDDETSATLGGIFRAANEFRDRVKGPLTRLVGDYQPYNQAVRRLHDEVNQVTRYISEFENKYLNLTAAACRSSSSSRGYNDWDRSSFSSPSPSAASFCAELGVTGKTQDEIDAAMLMSMAAGKSSSWSGIIQSPFSDNKVLDSASMSEVRDRVKGVRARMDSAKRGLAAVTSGAMMLQQMHAVMSDPHLASFLHLKMSDDDAAVLRGSMIAGSLATFSNPLQDVLMPLQNALARWNGQHESKAAGTDGAARSIKRVYDYHNRIVQAITAIVSAPGDIRAGCEQLRRLIVESTIADNSIRDPGDDDDDNGEGANGERRTRGFGHELGDKGRLAPPGRVSGFLFRVVDPVRVNRYLQQASKFRDFMATYRSTDIGEQLSLLEAELETQTKDATALTTASEADGGLAMDEGDVAAKMKALGDRRVRAASQFAAQVRDAVGMVVKMHRRFMLQQHSEAARYMQYWRDVADKSKKVEGDMHSKLKEHKEVLDDIASSAAKRIASNVNKDINVAMEKALQTGSLRLSGPQFQLIGDKMDSLATWVVRQNAGIHRLYATGGESLIDALLQPEFLTIYGLKLVRLAVVWLATTIASRAFQAIYRQRVYAEDRQPPHPAVMVAMVIGLDAVAHVIVGTVLIAARSVWHIETSVLQMWALDWTLVSVLVVSLSLILSHVVYSKKYFRYKYEGERGIRALQELMLRIYIVAVPIPFFRLTFG